MKLVSPPFLFFSLCVLLFKPTAPAQEVWPQFRGPTGMGLSDAKNVPVKWSTTRNVDWKIEVPGRGWSSPTLVDGKIYLTTAVTDKPRRDETDRSLRALCYDAASSEEVWNVEVFLQKAGEAQRVHGENSHASPTPIYEDGKVYVHYGHDGTACLDAATGEIVWKMNDLPYVPVHGNGGSPVIVGNLLIFSCDGRDEPFVAARDKATGRVAWKTPRNTTVQRNFSFSTPLVIEVQGQTQVVIPGSGAVIAYEPASGREIWRVDYEEGYSVVPRPAYSNGLLYVSSGFNTPNLYCIDPQGARGDVTETNVKWIHKKGVPKNSSPVVVGELLFMNDDTGIASCLDAVSGAVHWQERMKGNFWASPIYAEGRIYFTSKEGVTVVIEATESGFKEIAQNDLNELIQASPTPAPGALFMRTETMLYRIGTE